MYFYLCKYLLIIMLIAKYSISIIVLLTIVFCFKICRVRVTNTV